MGCTSPDGTSSIGTHNQASEPFLSRGAFAASLGGVDTLVFAGGIGENAAAVRQRICEGLEFIGVEIDASLNQRHAPRISSGAVAVRIIRTDEESVIAEMTARLLAVQGVEV